MNTRDTSSDLETLFEAFLKCEREADCVGMDRIRAESPALLQSLLSVRGEVLSTLRTLKEDEERQRKVRHLTARIRQNAPILAASLLSLTEDSDELVSSH